jgi:hypothetical protein
MTAYFLAKYGTPEHKQKLHNLNVGKRALISNGSDEDRHHIMQHPDFHKQIDLQTLIALHGSDTNRDELLRHSNHSTSCKLVARYGNDHHRDQLIDHHDSVVRAHVAHYGNKDHATILQNDPASNVSMAAIDNLFKLSTDAHKKRLKDDVDESQSILTVARNLL